MASVEKKKNFFVAAKEFIPEVKQEFNKVTWPTRRETVMTSIFVFVLAMIAAFFFLMVDQVNSRVIQFILQLGS